MTKFIKQTFKLLKNNELFFSLVIGLLVIVLVAGFGWYNNKLVPINPDPLAHYLKEPNNVFKFLSNWDGPHYLSIASHGYQNASLTKFLPLYPIVINLVNRIIPSLLISALLISWASFIASIFFYLKIVDLLFKTKDNFKRLNYLIFYVFFPTAIFFIATYSESLYAFCALAAIYFALKNRYLLSALFSIFFLITNSYGFLTLFFILLILYEQKNKLIKILTYLILSLSGVFGYALYLYFKFREPFAFILSQKENGWLNGKYIEIINNLNLFSILFAIGLIISAIYWWKKRKSFSLYSLSFLLIPLIGNQIGGFDRYVLMAFPMQLMAYDFLKNKPALLKIGFVVLGICFGYFLFQYAGGYIGG